MSQERLVRACHFSRGGFRRLCSSSISRLEPRLSPPVHYLNKQEKRRGRLAAACTTVSLPSSPSFSIINALLSSPSLLSLVSSHLFLFLSLSLFVILARSSALSKRYSDEQLSLPRKDAARKRRTSDRQGGACNGRSHPLHLVMNFKLPRIHNAVSLTVGMSRR